MSDIRTITVVDLSKYGEVAEILAGHLGSDAIAALSTQIQGFINVGLMAVNLTREAVQAETGDGAILVFEKAEQAHRFARAFFECVCEYNATKSPSQHRRFRMGASTGEVSKSVETTTLDGPIKSKGYQGIPIKTATRLESKSKPGNLLIDLETFKSLPEGLKAQYGPEEMITSKGREQLIQARSCPMIVETDCPRSIRIMAIYTPISVLCLSMLTIVCFQQFQLLTQAEIKNQQLGRAKSLSEVRNSELESIKGKLEEINSTLEVRNTKLRAQLSNPPQIGDLPMNQLFLSKFLSKKAPEVFYGSKDNIYDTARILPTNYYMRTETEFHKDLNDTQKTFDMLANNAGVVGETMAPFILNGLRRGVNYRFILSDYRPSNTNFALFEDTVDKQNAEAARGAAKDLHHKLDKIMKMLESDRKNADNVRAFSGTLEVKWNPKFLLYTMWLRDVNTPAAVGHLGIHFYRGKTYWPCFRFSRNTTDAIFPPPNIDQHNEFLELTKKEFDHMFNTKCLDYSALSEQLTSKPK